jgi:hypothetical protein
MVISIGRSWYVYGGMWNMCRGVIAEATGGIADMCCKKIRYSESQGLKGGDVCVCVCVCMCVSDLRLKGEEL